MRFHIRVLLALLLVCPLAACQLSTGVDGRTTPLGDLVCTNHAFPPNRFTEPHRWADTSALVVTMNGTLAPDLTGSVIVNYGVGHCLTFTDSLRRVAHQ